MKDYAAWSGVTIKPFKAQWLLYVPPRFNLLEPEFYIKILAHSVGKMQIIQEPNKVAL